MAQNNPLPDFFYHLAEAHAALQAVNDFDIDSFDQASQVEWEKLREEQSAMAAALIRYVQRHGDTLLKALADLESNRKSMQSGRTLRTDAAARLGGRDGPEEPDQQAG